jgi:hypothetical protein
VSASPVDSTAVAMQALQASQWELDPDKLLIGDRIAEVGCARPSCAGIAALGRQNAVAESLPGSSSSSCP